MPAKLVARFFLLAVHRDLLPESVRCPDRLTLVRFDCRCVCVRACVAARVGPNVIGLFMRDTGGL